MRRTFDRKSVPVMASSSSSPVDDLDESDLSIVELASEASEEALVTQHHEQVLREIAEEEDREISSALASAAATAPSSPSTTSSTTSSTSSSTEMVMARMTTEEAEVDEDGMTQSQFAQVVFHDVADSYPNDCDLLCRIGLNGLVEASPGDRVGIYRVPHVAPHEYLAFEWVLADESTTRGEEQNVSTSKDLQVEFKGCSLPKDEDYYQYQYLRSDNSVVGASIPFQLRSPKSEELCAVEDAEAFMVVQSNSALVSGQNKGRVQDLERKIKELERKHGDLLSLSERLNEALEDKSQSFIMLDEQCKSLLPERNRCEQLKKDLALVLEAKVDLEKKLHKALNDLDKMTTKMEAAITEQDFLRGKVQQCEQEKVLYQEESRQLMKKAEDLNSMLVALTKSKEMAVAEIKDSILKRDDCMRRAAELEKILFRMSGEAEILRVTMAGMEEEHREEVRMVKEMLREAEKEAVRANNGRTEYQMQNQALKSAINELTEKVGELQAALLGRTASSSSMTITGESLQMHQKYDSNDKGDSGSVLAVVSHDESQYRNRIEELEGHVRDLEMELRACEVTNAREIKTLRDGLEQVQRERSYTNSESSSTRNLDSIVIQNAIESAAAVQQNLINDSIVNSSIGDFAYPSLRSCQLCEEGPFANNLREYLTHLYDHYCAGVMARYLRLKEYSCADCPVTCQDVHAFSRHRGIDHQEIVDFISNDDVKEELRKLGWSEEDRQSLDKSLSKRVPNRNLDSMIIQNAAEFANMTLEDANEPSSPPLQPLQQQSLMSKSLASPGMAVRALGPQIPCSPPTQARSPLKAPIAFGRAAAPFLAQYPGSAFNNQLPQPIQEATMTQQQMNSEASNNSDLSELAAWAESGNVSSVPASRSQSTSPMPIPDGDRGRNPIMSSSSFTLTDDGRPVAVGEEEEEDEDGEVEGAVGGESRRRRKSRLHCPLCDVSFNLGQVRELEFHVDSHLATSNNCPVCQEPFSLADIGAFERHVQEHFTADEFSMVGGPEDNFGQLRPSAPTEGGGAVGGRNPFQVVGHVASNVTTTLTNSIRSWTLDID